MKTVIDGIAYKVKFDYIKANNIAAVALAGVYLPYSRVNLLNALSSEVLNKISEQLLQSDARYKKDGT